MILRIIITIILMATTACAKPKPLEYQDWPLDTALDAGDSLRFGGTDGVLDVAGPCTVHWEYDQNTGLLRGNGLIFDPSHITEWMLSEAQANAYYLVYPRVQYLVEEQGVDLYSAVAILESEIAMVIDQAREAYATRYVEDPVFIDEWDWLSNRKPYLESLCAAALQDSLVQSARVLDDEVVWKSGSYIQIIFVGGLCQSFELYSAFKRDELANAPVPEHSLQMSSEVACQFILSMNRCFSLCDADLDFVDGHSFELN